MRRADASAVAGPAVVGEIGGASIVVAAAAGDAAFAVERIQAIGPDKT